MGSRGVIYQAAWNGLAIGSMSVSYHEVGTGVSYYEVSIGVSYHEAMIPGIRQVTGSRPHAPIKPTGSKGNKVPGIAYRHTHPEATETLCPSAHVLKRIRGGVKWGLGAILKTLVNLFGVCL